MRRQWLERARRAVCVLEARTPGRVGGVVFFDPDLESPSDALLRSDRSGASLVMPIAKSESAWEFEAADCQARLLARAAAWEATGHDPN